jgi:hypothetical protein
MSFIFAMQNYVDDALSCLSFGRNIAEKRMRGSGGGRFVSGVSLVSLLFPCVMRKPPLAGHE